jgi:chromosome segregation ATPase
MVCSMVKKGVLGAALTAGALYLAFGTSAPSYVRTAFHKVRHNAQNSVPLPFEIDRAREEVDRLEPAIKDCLETAVRTEVEVEHLDKEIAVVRANLGQEERAILALRDTVKTGEVHRVGRATYTTEEVKGDLARRLDHYRNVKRILEEKEGTLKAKRNIMETARRQLTSMRAQKKELLTKLEAIDARLKLIEATKQTNDFNFDESALSRAKQTVADLEKRVEIQARLADEEGRFSEASIPFVDPSRDVLKEVDAEFGTAKASDAKSGDKSL